MEKVHTLVIHMKLNLSFSITLHHIPLIFASFLNSVMVCIHSFLFKQNSVLPSSWNYNSKIRNQFFVDHNGTILQALNGLKVVWLDSHWLGVLGHVSLKVFKSFMLASKFFYNTISKVFNCLALKTIQFIFWLRDRLGLPNPAIKSEPLNFSFLRG